MCLAWLTARVFHVPMRRAGGGGLVAGIAAYVKALKPHIKIIGVEPTGANAMAQSLALGQRVTLSKVDAFAGGLMGIGGWGRRPHCLGHRSCAYLCGDFLSPAPPRPSPCSPTCLPSHTRTQPTDGVAVKHVGAETFRLCRELVDGVVLVDNAAVSAAIKVRSVVRLAVGAVVYAVSGG